MARFTLADLVIAITETDSNELTKRNLHNAKYIAISAPSTLVEVVTVHVSVDGGATYGALQSAGEDVVVTAGGVTVINTTPFNGLMLVADGAVAATRTFKVMGQDEV